MKVIVPTPVTPAMLVSNVPVDDGPPWTAGSYDKGKKVVLNNHVFESLGDGNTENPATDSSPPKWLDLGATNRWRMLDKGAAQLIGDTPNQRQVYLIGTKTSNPGSIDITITPGAVVNAVALFGLTGYRATVTMTDPFDGVVYSNVVSLVEPSANGMWEWLFKPIGRRETIALLDLPAYGTASIRIQIEAVAGGIATCSMASVGYLQEIGDACFGTSFGITDFSLKKVDDFGVETVTERGYRDRVQFDVRIKTDDIDNAKRILIGLRAKGAVYVGDVKRQSTIIFGRFRDLQVVIDNLAVCPCALDVGSLL